MQLASIREFRTSLSAYTKTGAMVLVLNHGKMVGCFVPLHQTHDIPIELKKEFIAHLGKKIASYLSTRKVKEKDILSDFSAFKKNRRRQ